MIAEALTFAALLFLVQWRNYMTLRIRRHAIHLDFDAYLSGPGYSEMMFDLTKWTFAAFYPNIKAAQS